MINERGQITTQAINSRYDSNYFGGRQIFLLTLLSILFCQCSDNPSNSVGDAHGTDGSVSDTIVGTSSLSDTINEAPIVIVYGEEESGVDASHEYVDLDLPSGILWAVYNVGATKPEEYGDLFAWGETSPKKIYTTDTYKWYDEKRQDMKEKYCPEPTNYMDQLEEKRYILLEPNDDAATTVWDSTWRMPRYEEIKELMNGCYWEWTSNYNGTDVAGNIGTSKKNGKTIFFPAAGLIDSSFCKGRDQKGYYWSKSLSGDFYFDSTLINYDHYHQEFGKSVRAVRYNKSKVNTYIKTDVQSYHNSAEKNIRAIENAECTPIDHADFMSPDARLHDVRGRVAAVIEYHVETNPAYYRNLHEIRFNDNSKYCVFEDMEDFIKIYAFDSIGNAVYLPLASENTPSEYIVLRNGKGELLEYSHSYQDLDYDPNVYFSYDKNGMLDSMYYYGIVGGPTTFKYDKDQNLKSSYSYVTGSSETSEKDFSTYSIVKKDRYGNWIKRYVCIHRNIAEGADSKNKVIYRVDYRKIIYAND
ncbi:MAG: hypothetical protein J5767_04770 [Paludibacteraceae bacterium]|nr:hypothetical protein [Paludibacteraceae bacterium]